LTLDWVEGEERRRREEFCVFAYDERESKALFIQGHDKIR